MLVGILGGSFNPPHLGHLALARTPLDLGLVEMVVLVPAAMPPHKTAPPEADPETRLVMTRLLAEEDPRLGVDDIELRRSGPSFTIDTVRQLLAANPGNRYRLIIGSDMAKSFATWREYGDLIKLAPSLVAERPDSVFAGSPATDYRNLNQEQVRVMQDGRFPMTPVDSSSTKVRALLADGADEATLLRHLTRPVLDYIVAHGLYRNGKQNM